MVTESLQSFGFQFEATEFSSGSTSDVPRTWLFTPRNVREIHQIMCANTDGNCTGYSRKWRSACTILNIPRSQCRVTSANRRYVGCIPNGKLFFKKAMERRCRDKTSGLSTTGITNGESNIFFVIRITEIKMKRGITIFSFLLSFRRKCHNNTYEIIIMLFY